MPEHGQKKRLRTGNHKWVRKYRRGKRKTGILWEYNWDGQFAHEHWDKKDQKYWKRWLRHEGKADLKDRIDDQERSGTDGHAHQNPHES